MDRAGPTSPLDVGASPLLVVADGVIDHFSVIFGNFYIETKTKVNIDTEMDKKRRNWSSYTSVATPSVNVAGSRLRRWSQNNLRIHEY